MVADTLSRPSTLCPEQSDEECLLIKQKIQKATNRNKTIRENVENDFRLEQLLLPCDAAHEVCCMAPDDDNLMEVLVMDFEKLADAQN